MGKKKDSNKGGSKKKVSIVNVILVLIILLGLGIMGYPTFSNWWNSIHQTQAISEYMKRAAELDEEEIKKIWERAEKFNEMLRGKPDRYHLSEEEKKEYYSILNITGDGILGYIEIPRIKVSLPIYHGTSESILQVAIGHLEGSSIPIGGEGTHALVSGHRGLPSARLFTDLDKLETGDKFVIQVLDRTMTYEVDQIRIVLPNELQDLGIENNKDYVTLITCTPYAVNTHRLLVRGHRTTNDLDDEHIVNDAMRFEAAVIAPIVGAPILMLLLILALFKPKYSMGRQERIRILRDAYRRRRKDE